jgi:hypothetical protein
LRAAIREKGEEHNGPGPDGSQTFQARPTQRCPDPPLMSCPRPLLRGARRRWG